MWARQRSATPSLTPTASAFQASLHVVARERLRHCKWHTTAFVGFTNEKRHDGASSQHMLNWQLKNFWAPRAEAAKAGAHANANADAATAPSPTTVTATSGSPTAAVSPTATTPPTATAASTAQAVAQPTVVTLAVPIPTVHASVPSEANTNRRFQQWQLEQDMVEFWAFVGHSDNATHFKSGKMFHYWSNLSHDIEFIKMVWINFGCPGHGKGPWDGFGAVVKTKGSMQSPNNAQHRAKRPAPYKGVGICLKLKI